MKQQNVPLSKVLSVAFGFHLETTAELPLETAIELVLKSKVKEKQEVIGKLLGEFGMSSDLYFMSHRGA